MTDDETNSVLTGGQRDLLRKSEEQRESDYSRQARSHHRRQIVERTRQAFHDFSLLAQELDEHERNRIFDPPADDAHEFMETVFETIAFLYYCMEESSETNTVQGQSNTRSFKSALKNGIQRGEQYRHSDDLEAIVSVDVDVNVTPLSNDMVDWDMAIEAIAENELSRIDEKTLRAVIARYNTPDELRELSDIIDERRDRGDDLETNQKSNTD